MFGTSLHAQISLLFHASYRISFQNTDLITSVPQYNTQLPPSLRISPWQIISFLLSHIQSLILYPELSLHQMIVLESHPHPKLSTFPQNTSVLLVHGSFLAWWYTECSWCNCRKTTQNVPETSVQTLYRRQTTRWLLPHWSSYCLIA